VLVKRCPGFQTFNLPHDTVCKGTDDRTCTLRFPSTDAIKANVRYEFQLEITNPKNNVVQSQNFWKFQTYRPDGIGKDTTTYQGYYLYPYDFSSFTVLPDTRRAGITRVTVRFQPKADLPSGGFVRIRAPLKVNWDHNNLGFSTAPTDTQANVFNTGPATVESSDPMDNSHKNQLVVRVTNNALAGFEYGIVGNIIVPAVTPVPNAWWIEQFSETGMPPPNDFNYISSKGTPGFRTQALMGASVSPYNFVAEAWENPTTIKFETTTGASSEITPKGTVTLQAKILIEAPPGFTFICPLEPPAVMEPGYEQLPDDVTCEINHTDESERNKLHILIMHTPLKVNTKYQIEADVVNAASVNPTTNYWTLTTQTVDVENQN
jgi:hypothetical protein